MKKLIPLLLLASCTSLEQYQAAGSSLTFGYGINRGDWSLNKQGHREGDTESYSLFFSYDPFRYWAYKLQAEMQARAVIEAAYASRPEPEPECEPE